MGISLRSNYRKKNWNWLSFLPFIFIFKQCATQLPCEANHWYHGAYLSTYLLLSMGPSINDVASLEGGRGGQIDNMGRYEGGRCQRKCDIVNSRLADYNLFFNVIYINCLETDFMNIPRLRHYIEHLKLVPKQF